jgi:hypothetical protein
MTEEVLDSFLFENKGGCRLVVHVWSVLGDMGFIN